MDNVTNAATLNLEQFHYFTLRKTGAGGKVVIHVSDHELSVPKAGSTDVKDFIYDADFNNYHYYYYYFFSVEINPTFAI